MKPVLSIRLLRAQRELVNPPMCRVRSRQPNDFRGLASRSRGYAGCVELSGRRARIRAEIPLLGSVR